MNRKKKIICIVLCIAMVVTVSGGFNKKISPKHIFAYSENMVNTAQVASDAAIQTEMPVTKTATPGAAEPSETTSGGVIIAPTIKPDYVVAPTIKPTVKPTKSPNSSKNGFVVNANGRYYYKDGKMVKNKWMKIDGKKYYFKSNGAAAIGYRNINGKGYYFTSSGVMYTGFVNINGKKYYFGKNGVKVCSKKKIGRYMCYFRKFGALYRKIDTKKKLVALTYDDGPSKNTNTILNILKKNNSVATFFEVGNRIASYKSIVKKIDRMGCEIGNHTYGHKILTGCSRAEIKKQINGTNNVLKKVIGKKTIITRPPGGNHSAVIDKIINTPVIIWSLDTKDWKNRNAAMVTDAVLKNIKDGDIVLMHDLYKSTADASKKIIPTLVKRGYQLVTVSELSDCRKAMKKGSSYSAFR